MNPAKSEEEFSMESSGIMSIGYLSRANSRKQTFAHPRAIEQDFTFDGSFRDILDKSIRASHLSTTKRKDKNNSDPTGVACYQKCILF